MSRPTRSLLERGIETLRWAFTGKNALHCAAEAGDAARVQALLAAGDDANSTARNGMSPLHFVAFRGNPGLVQLLLGHGAEVDALDRELQATPLHLAAAGGRLDVVRLLLDHQANIEAQTSDGATPLYEAAKRGQKKVVEFLLGRDADPNAATTKGMSPLMVAIGVAMAQAASQTGDLSKQESLPVTGMLDRVAAWPTEDVWMDIVGLLIAHGANVNAVDSQGYCPLSLAVGARSRHMVELLLQNGANTFEVKTAGVTSLDIATEFIDAAVVALLEDAASSQMKGSAHDCRQDLRQRGTNQGGRSDLVRSLPCRTSALADQPTKELSLATSVSTPSTPHRGTPLAAAKSPVSQRTTQIPLCPSCDVIYPESTTSNISTCPKCGTSLIKRDFFVRWKIERIVFVAILAAVCACFKLVLGGLRGELVMPWDAGGTPWHWMALVCFVMLLPYMAGPFLLGLPKWKEYIPCERMSSADCDELFTFRWRRLLLESLVTAGLLVLLMVSLGVITLVSVVFTRWREIAR